MLKVSLRVVGLSLALVCGQALGQAATGLAQVTPELEARLKTKVANAIPHMAVQSVLPGPFAGIYAITLSDGPVLYTDAQGDFLIAGDLYKIEGRKLVNLAELAQMAERKPLLASLNKDDMIVFPAEGKTRGALYVFTDVDCGYCRKLHQEVPALNKAGVEVRYLAYPRAGVASASANKLAQAWCADDKREALTQLKQGRSLSSAACDSAPIAEQYRLGGQMGVRGTPAIFLESGEAIPGYRPSDELLSLMGLKSQG